MESIISQTKFLQSKIPEDICHSQNCVVETSDRTLPPHDNPPLTPGGHLESDASNGVASLDFLARATEYAGLGTENDHEIESAVEGIIAPELRNETNGGATHLETSGGVSVERTAGISAGVGRVEDGVRLNAGVGADVTRTACINC